MNSADADRQRAEMLSRWDEAASGWGNRADRIRDWGMPVSTWMIDRLALQPGERLLELAAGPGDTGFLAAELLQPGGTLICSDGSEAMLGVARERARRLAIDNVEFKQLQLEWIDLPTASVDAIVCRWGLMLTLDPAAAIQEARRVLRPGGRIAVAVWDEAARNPWGTIPSRALIELGHAEAPAPNAPGMFALAAPGRLAEELAAGGFVGVEIGAVDLERSYEDVEAYLEETVEISSTFSAALATLSSNHRAQVRDLIAELAAAFTDQAGAIRLPGTSLVGAANA